MQSFNHKIKHLNIILISHIIGKYRVADIYAFLYKKFNLTSYRISSYFRLYNNQQLHQIAYLGLLDKKSDMTNMIYQIWQSTKKLISNIA